MKILSAFALAAILGAGVAAAAGAETFDVSGAGPDGKAYTGTVTLTEIAAPKMAGQAFSVEWTFGTDKVTGLGIVSKDDAKMLSIGYGTPGHLTVVLMKEDAGKATGTWWSDGLPGTGVETWTKK